MMGIMRIALHLIPRRSSRMRLSLSERRLLLRLRFGCAACTLVEGGARCDAHLTYSLNHSPHTLTAFIITRLPSNSKGDTFNNGVFVRVVPVIPLSCALFTSSPPSSPSSAAYLFTIHTILSPLFPQLCLGPGWEARWAGCRCFAFLLFSFSLVWGVREGFARFFLLRERKADSLFLSSSLSLLVVYPLPSFCYILHTAVVKKGWNLWVWLGSPR